MNMKVGSTTTGTVDIFFNNAAAGYGAKNKVPEPAVNRMYDIAQQIIDDNTETEGDGPGLRDPIKKNGDSTSRLLLQNAQFIQLTNQLTENTLSQALASATSALMARKKEATELSEALDEASTELEEAMSGLEGASETLDAKIAALNELKTRLAALQNSLNDLLPDDPQFADLQKAILQLNTTITTASAEVADAESNVMQKLELSQSLLAKHYDLIQLAILKSTNPDGKLVLNQELIMDEEQKHQSFLQRMAELMEQLIQTMGESNLIKIKNDRVQNEMKLQALQVELLEKSKKLLEDMAKAAEAAAKSACISKILGPALMVIGAVTSMFGGVALMAIGIGLTIIDYAGEKFLNFSLTGMLVEKVFMPLVEQVKKATDFVLDEMGVGELIGENAMEMFRQATAMVVTAVAVVAVAYAAKSAGNKLYEKFGAAMGAAIVGTITESIQKVIETMAKELPKLLTRAMGAIKNIAQQGLKQLDDMIASALKKLAVSPATATTMLNMLAELAAVAEVINRSTFGIINGIHTKNIHQSDAELKFTEEINEMIRKAVERMADTIKAGDDQLNNLSEELTNLMQSSKEAAQYLISRRPA